MVHGIEIQFNSDSLRRAAQTEVLLLLSLSLASSVTDLQEKRGLEEVFF